MSNRLNFFFTEAIRSLTTNVATTISATVTMLLALLLVGGFSLIFSVVQKQADIVEHDAGRVKVFLAGSITEDQTNNLRGRLKGFPEVDTVEYVSKKEAFQRAKKLFREDPDALKALPYNPFPASLEAKLKQPERVKIIANKMRNEEGVQKVSYGGQMAERLIHITNVFKWFVIVIAALLIAAAAILIANAIRLSIFSRRREIEVMKLVGASNTFVRFPFMLEGLICGMIAALLAIGIILAVNGLIHELVDKLAPGLEADHKTEILLGMLILGVGLGGMSSAMTIRKYLRV